MSIKPVALYGRVSTSQQDTVSVAAEREHEPGHTETTPTPLNDSETSFCASKLPKCAVYVRVSKDKDANDGRYQEPDNQAQPLKNWAQGLGFEIFDVYEDRVSGADPNRPQFKKLRMDAHQRRFKTVLIWSLDRLSREGILATLSYIRELRGFGVGVRSYQEQWLDTSINNPMAELILAVLSWAAQQERIRISERTKAGIQRRRNIGQWRGGRPKGSTDKHPRQKRVGYASTVGTNGNQKTSVFSG